MQQNSTMNWNNREVKIKSNPYLMQPSCVRKQQSLPRNDLTSQKSMNSPKIMYQVYAEQTSPFTSSYRDSQYQNMQTMNNINNNMNMNIMKKNETRYHTTSKSALYQPYNIEINNFKKDMNQIMMKQIQKFNKQIELQNVQIRTLEIQLDQNKKQLNKKQDIINTIQQNQIIIIKQKKEIKKEIIINENQKYLYKKIIDQQNKLKIIIQHVEEQNYQINQKINKIYYIIHNIWNQKIKQLYFHINYFQSKNFNIFSKAQTNLNKFNQHFLLIYTKFQEIQQNLNLLEQSSSLLWKQPYEDYHKQTDLTFQGQLNEQTITEDYFFHPNQEEFQNDRIKNLYDILSKNKQQKIKCYIDYNNGYLKQYQSRKFIYDYKGNLIMLNQAQIQYFVSHNVIDIIKIGQ